MDELEFYDLKSSGAEIDLSVQLAHRHDNKAFLDTLEQALLDAKLDESQVQELIDNALKDLDLSGGGGSGDGNVDLIEVNKAIAELKTRVDTLELDPVTKAEVVQIVQNAIDGLDLSGGGSGEVSWNDISDKPTEFIPAPHTHMIAQVNNLQDQLDSKQAVLVSGSNIKTINGTSLLGSGDIVIEAGDGGISSESDPIYTQDKPSIALRSEVAMEIATAVGNIVSDEIEPMQEVLTQVTQEINELDSRVATIENTPTPQIYEYEINAIGSWTSPTPVSFAEYHIGYYSSNPNLATIDDVLADLRINNAFSFFFSRFVSLTGVRSGNFWVYNNSNMAFNYQDLTDATRQKLNCYPNDGSDGTNVSFTVIRKRQLINR